MLDIDASKISQRGKIRQGKRLGLPPSELPTLRDMDRFVTTLGARVTRS